MSLDDSLLPQILARWRTACRPALVNKGAYQGFSGAMIVRVGSESGEFCLRGWPASGPALERLHGLHRLLAHVEDAGVAYVPVPLKADSGDTLVATQGRWWQLEPWKPGAADFHEHPSDARLRNALAALAAFHQAAWSFEATAAERLWFATRVSGSPSSILERRRQLAAWRPPEIRVLRQAMEADTTRFAELGREILKHASRLAPAVRVELDSAAGLCLSLGPCIRDVWHDHVLFTGDEVTGLIDLAACRTDHVAADLSRLLGSLCGNDLRRWDLALDVYRRHRPLSIEELGLIPVLDRSGVLLSGLLWLRRRYLRQEPIADLPRVCARLQAFLERLRQMS